MKHILQTLVMMMYNRVHSQREKTATEAREKKLQEWLPILLSTGCKHSFHFGQFSSFNFVFVYCT